MFDTLPANKEPFPKEWFIIIIIKERNIFINSYYIRFYLNLTV